MADVTSGTADDAVDVALRRAFADEWSHVVATLIRLTGDWALAEDCAQEAFARAAVRWPHDGVPLRPGAWLTTVARNEAHDRLRRRATERRRMRDVALVEERAAAEHVVTGGEDVPDDRLRLVFTCAHPALPLDARVALTLRTVAGLTVPEIARAFGVGEAAMAKRLVRARQKITHARIPYRVPQRDQLPARLGGVLAVVYLVFTEGYSASAGDSPVRAELCAEAVRLARLLTELLPHEPEVHALVALELLHDARRPARLDADGELVPLDAQDRALWDRATAEDGVRALRTAQRLARGDSPYLLQAEIAACHSTSSSAASTDWRTVVHLYDRLLAIAPTPHAALARAVALGSAGEPARGLAALRTLLADDGAAA
ncbi:sigma-70 family RNA polymerase sigma factor, partial [Cellulomonas sp. APG4]|uniref:RNA polymerase sigma factor n=1 Tax=Cellulomonas sp. APG4 TaxID=1538656 RepID=UPI00192A36F4